MRGNIPWMLTVLVTALIQTTWLGAIRVEGVLPDLCLLIVVYFAVVSGEERAMFTGVLAGVFQDVTGHFVLGHHVLCNAVIGYAAARLANRLITQHPAVKAALVFVAGMAHGLLFTAIAYIQDPGINALHAVLSVVIPSVFYTTLLTPLVFFLLDLLFRRTLTAPGEVG